MYEGHRYELYAFKLVSLLEREEEEEQITSHFHNVHTELLLPYHQDLPMIPGYRKTAKHHRTNASCDSTNKYQRGRLCLLHQENERYHYPQKPLYSVNNDTHENYTARHAAMSMKCHGVQG